MEIVNFEIGTMKKKSVEYSLKATKQDFVIEKIISSKNAFDYTKKFYFDDILIYESVFIILLNTQYNTIGYAKISQGGVSGAIVDIKIIAKYAIETLASYVILVHNHPSGSVRPSKIDDSLTMKVKEGLGILDIHLKDHLIITDNAYYSYSDEGRL